MNIEQGKEVDSQSDILERIQQLEKIAIKFEVRLNQIEDQINLVDQINETSMQADSSVFPFENLSLQVKLVESNDISTKYSWKFGLKNIKEKTCKLQARIQFFDADEFEVDDYMEYNLFIRALEDKYWTGTTLIGASIANQVSSFGLIVHEVLD